MQSDDNARAAPAQGQSNKLNRGVLFRNSRKTATNQAADFTGTIDVDGVTHWLNAWENVSAKGTRYLSLSIRPKTDQAKAKPAEKSGGAPRFGDLPF